jgi:dihydropteroate synthase
MLLSRARNSAPKDLGIDLLILKEKRRKPVIEIQDDGLISAEKSETWELDPKGCFRIALCEIEAKDERTRKICAFHSPSGKRIIGTAAQEIMDTILRLNLVSLLEHVSYLSRELTKAELALQLNRSYEQDEAIF